MLYNNPVLLKLNDLIKEAVRQAEARLAFRHEQDLFYLCHAVSTVLLCPRCRPRMTRTLIPVSSLVMVLMVTLGPATSLDLGRAGVWDSPLATDQFVQQVSWDWWTAGHVTTVLTSDWCSTASCSGAAGAACRASGRCRAASRRPASSSSRGWRP